MCLAALLLSISPFFLGLPVHANDVIASGRLVNMKINNLRHQLYVANQSDNTVLVVNTTSNHVVTKIPVGPKPFGMDVSASGKELFVALEGTKALDVVNLTSLTLSGSIALTTVPLDVAAGVDGRAYVTSDDSGPPVIVDTINRTQVATINSAGLIYRALARISPDRHSLFIGETGLDPGKFYKFSVQTDNVTLLATSTFEADNLADFAMSPDGLTGYAAAGAPYFISVFSTADLSLIGQLDTSYYPNSVSLAENGKLAFATHESYEVIAFNTTTHTVVNRFPLAHQAVQVRATEQGDKVYALTGDSYGTTYLEVVDTIPPTWPSDSSLDSVSTGICSISLNWTSAYDDAGIRSYQIYENSSLITTTSGDVHSYNVSGVCAGSTYVFKVEASDGTSSTISGPSVTVTPPPNRPPAPPPQLGEARLLYQGFAAGTFRLGQDAVIMNKFTNLGAVPVTVNSLTLTGDLGGFAQTRGLPLLLDPTASTVLNMTIKIPASVWLGNHRVEVTVGWQYFNPNIAEWQIAPDIVKEATIRVGPPTLTQSVAALAALFRSYGSELLIGLVTYVSIVSVAAVFVVREENSSRSKRRADNLTRFLSRERVN